MYRPFCRSFMYFDRLFNARVYLFPSIFPTATHTNQVISVTGKGSNKVWSTLIADKLIEFQTLSNGQCFPRYYSYYVGAGGRSDGDFFEQSETPDEHGYVCRDAITDWALEAYQRHYDDATITKDAIFWYVYGLLHSPDYRERFGNNLKRGLPRIPFVADFWAFSRIGSELADWHLNYETIDPYPLEELTTESRERDPSVHDKMRFAGKRGNLDKSKVVVNSTLTLGGIPEEAYEYQVNGKSPVEWIVERYQISTDKKSGIRNDPNTYSVDPEYIVNLIKRVVRVSLETRRLVQQLPAMEIEEDPVYQSAG